MVKKWVTFIKFGLVGVLNTAIDFAVFALLTFFGLPYLISQCISYGCGVLNSYIVNRSWTFQQENKADRREFGKFVFVNVLTLAITSALLAAFYQGLGLPLLAGKLAATILGVLVNFAGSRFWVFKSYRKKEN